jgi:hypothetical protein
MHHYKWMVAVLVGLFLAGCSQTLSSEQDKFSGLESELAKSADSFVESIGINTHYYYLERTFSDNTTIRSKLEDLGIRHIRDGLDLNFFSDPKNQALLGDLNALGIRFSFITDPKLYSAEQVRDWVKQVGPEKFMSIENRNEPDHFDRQPDGSWPVQEVRDYQVALWNALKNDEATKNIEVIGPPVTSAEAAEVFGSSVADYMDRANIHNYLSTREPETLGWGGDGYGSLDYAIRRAAEPMKPGNKTPLSTETCYQNTDDINGLPEKFSGRYIPRQYLFSFINGIPRTYCYQLWDEGQDKQAGGLNFGFLRFNGSPKPAYTAVQNMISLLSDPGESFEPSRLEYGLDGETDGLQKLLLQKRNGDFYLAVWLGKQSWDPINQTEIDIPDQNITLTLPPQISHAASYTLNAEGQMRTEELRIAEGQLELTVSDDVAFIKLSDCETPEQE